MLSPKATFHSQEYKDMRYTDWYKDDKQRKLKLWCHQKANVPQTGVTQHEVPVHTHASAMHTGPKLCPSSVSTAQDTKGYSYSTNQ